MVDIRCYITIRTSPVTRSVRKDLPFIDFVYCPEFVHVEYSQKKSVSFYNSAPVRYCREHLSSLLFMDYILISFDVPEANASVARQADCNLYHSGKIGFLSQRFLWRVCSKTLSGMRGPSACKQARHSGERRGLGTSVRFHYFRRATLGISSILGKFDEHLDSYSQL